MEETRLFERSSSGMMSTSAAGWNSSRTVRGNLKLVLRTWKPAIRRCGESIQTKRSRSHGSRASGGPSSASRNGNRTNPRKGDRNNSNNKQHETTTVYP